MKLRLVQAAYLALPVAIYTYLFARLKFVQDDAYISYRYVANFLEGHGLVYNFGERVEGFTNFGWVIILSLFGSAGTDFILASQVLGAVFGAGVILVTFLYATGEGGKSHFVAAAAALLLAVNLSLAYWSPAGLETSAFAFFAMLSLYFYTSRNWLLMFTLTMAVWIRPEGALIAGMLIVIETLIERRLPRFTLACTGVAFVLSLPMVIFKISYYGSILPNPFYAKTGFSLDQLKSGAEYVARFLSHYGLYGAGLLVPALFWKSLSKHLKSAWLFVVIFALYILVVGGDVLKVHRFFVPVMGLYALLLVTSVVLITSKIRGSRLGTAVATVVVLSLAGYSLWAPWSFVHQYNIAEKGLAQKMSSLAHDIKATDSTNFSVALPTIGIFGYEMLGHDVIDMLGLTDSTIARHPEAPIPGMESTWKETHHNSKYLLERAPDYILFSTGVKPSAPAEKALLLHSAFMESYKTIGWVYRTDASGKAGLNSAFKRMRPVRGEIVADYPVAWVESYKRGIEHSFVGEYPSAIEYFRDATEKSPRPYYGDLLYQIGSAFKKMKMHREAYTVLEDAIEQDSLNFGAHKELYVYNRALGETEKAEAGKRWLEMMVPWYVPRLEMQAERAVRQQELAMKKRLSGDSK